MTTWLKLVMSQTRKKVQQLRFAGTDTPEIAIGTDFDAEADAFRKSSP